MVARTGFLNVLADIELIVLQSFENILQVVHFL